MASSRNARHEYSTRTSQCPHDNEANFEKIPSRAHSAWSLYETLVGGGPFGALLSLVKVCESVE